MTRLIIANWKSNKDTASVTAWLEAYGKLQNDIELESAQSLKVVIAPSFIHTHLVADFLSSFDLRIPTFLGLQDFSSFPAGSYTGAVSGPNVQGLDVQYAIVGHSERRRYFHETHHDVALKVEQALRHNITPIVCVDREYLAAQAAAILPELLPEVVVAYEPLAAIGNGHNADVGLVTEVMSEIVTHFGDVPIIYGGSVDEKNVAEYLLVCQGALVATASLEVEQFFNLIQKSA